jgi:hypothetical protein
MLSAAKHLQCLVEDEPMQILRPSADGLRMTRLADFFTMPDDRTLVDGV